MIWFFGHEKNLYNSGKLLFNSTSIYYIDCREETIVKMKRLIAFILALMMLLASFACTKSVKKEETAATPEPTSAPTAEPTEVPTPTPEPGPSASELLKQLDDDFFMEYVQQDLSTLKQYIKYPEKLGIDVNEVEITWGSFAKEEDDESIEWYQELYERLMAIDRSELSEAEQMTYDCMKRDFEQTIASGNYYGCYEPLRKIVGLQTDLPLEFWFFDINNKWDAEAYLTLLADVPRFYADLLTYEQYRASIGLFMTEENLDGVKSDLDDIINVRDSIFLIKTFDDAIDLLTDITPEEAADLKARNLSLLTNEFYQAHVDLKEGLEALRPYCREPLGASISNNDLYKNYYVETLIATCNDNKNVEEIAAILQNQMRNSLNEFYRAAGDLGYYPDNVRITKGDMDSNIAYLHEVLDPVLPEIPEVNVVYRDVPEELSDMLSPAAYLIPSFDDWQNNLIILNKPEEDSQLMMTLAHEGYNGHLYQYMYHRSMGISRTQMLLETTAYAEAWSQESERLLATYATGDYDPRVLTCEHAWGQYALMLEAYCSVLVNGLDYDLEKFTKYIKSLRYDEDLAKELYQFSVDNPFYYMNYAYSYARLQDIYNNAKTKLGDKFNEKEFFKTYLDCGPAPFDLIEARIDAWADGQL